MASYPSPNPRNALYNQVDYVQKNFTDQEIQAKLDGKLNYNNAQGLETFGSGIVINGQGTSNGLFVSNSGVDTIPNFQINSTATLAGTNINIGAGMASASYNPMVQLDDAVITYGIAGGSNTGRLDICPVGTTGGVYFDNNGIAHAQYPIGATANDNTLATTAFVVSQGGGSGVKTNQNNTFLQPYIQSFTCSPTVSNTTAPLQLLNSTSTESASLYIDPSPNNDVTLYSGQTNGGLTIRNISGNSFTVNPSAPNNTAAFLNPISTTSGLYFPSAAGAGFTPYIAGGTAASQAINLVAGYVNLYDVANLSNSIKIDTTAPNTLSLGSDVGLLNCGNTKITGSLTVTNGTNNSTLTTTATGLNVNDPIVATGNITGNNLIISTATGSLSYPAAALGSNPPFISGGGAGSGVINIAAASLGLLDVANGANNVTLDATGPNTLTLSAGAANVNCGYINLTQVGSSLSFAGAASGPYTPYISSAGANTAGLNVVTSYLSILDVQNLSNYITLDATAPNTLSVGGGGAGTLNCGPTNITGGIALRPVGQDSYSIYSQNGFGLVIANQNGLGTLTFSNGSTTLTTMTSTTTGLVVSSPLITQSLTLSSGSYSSVLTTTSTGLNVNDTIVSTGSVDCQGINANNNSLTVGGISALAQGTNANVGTDTITAAGLYLARNGQVGQNEFDIIAINKQAGATAMMNIYTEPSQFQGGVSQPLISLTDTQAYLNGSPIQTAATTGNQFYTYVLTTTGNPNYVLTLGVSMTQNSTTSIIYTTSSEAFTYNASFSATLTLPDYIYPNGKSGIVTGGQAYINSASGQIYVCNVTLFNPTQFYISNNNIPGGSPTGCTLVFNLTVSF